MPRSLRPRTSDGHGLSYRPYPEPRVSSRAAPVERASALADRPIGPTSARQSRRQTRTSAQWPPEDDERVQELFRQKLTWSHIAQIMGRTQDACRQRHKRIKKQMLAENLDLEAIVMAYARARDDFWSRVASAAGVDQGERAEDLVMRLSLNEINKIANRGLQRVSEDYEASEDHKDDIDINSSDGEVEQDTAEPSHLHNHDTRSQQPTSAVNQRSSDVEYHRAREAMKITKVLSPSPPAEMASEPVKLDHDSRDEAREVGTMSHSGLKSRRARAR